MRQDTSSYTKAYSTGSHLLVKDSLSDKEVWRVLVTPYGGPDGPTIPSVYAVISALDTSKDLGMDYFTPHTDFLDGSVSMLKSFYEHSMNSDKNAEMPEDRQSLGKATLVSPGDLTLEHKSWGRWFDFEISRSLEYFEYLESLKNLGIMGASTQAYKNGVTRKDSGELARWWENEVSLTPTPMNALTINQIYTLEKTFGSSFSGKYDDIIIIRKPEDVNMAKNAKTPLKSEQPEETPVPTPTAEDPTTEPAVEPEKEKTPEEETPEEFEKAMKEILPTSGESADSLDAKTFDQRLKVIEDSMKRLESNFSVYVDMWGKAEDLPELLGKLSGMTDAMEKHMTVVQSEIEDTRKGVTHIAGYVAEQVIEAVEGTVKSEVRKSKYETASPAAPHTPRQKSVSVRGPHFPEGAPGS